MKKKSGILITLFCLTALLLFAPLLQQHLRFFSFEKLYGYSEPVKKPGFTFDTYKSGAYQRQAEDYLKENVGFHEPLIRMYNQFIYDFFKTTNNREISIGKDGWLYHTESALHYFGNMESWFGMTNSQVRDNIIIQARSLAKLNAILKEYDVQLLTFTLPTKSFIYPEHLRKQPVGDTTFNAVPFLAHQLDSLGVPHINMIPWFQQLQDTIPFDLFYSKGSHWAGGTPMAVDTMLRAMEQIGGQSLAHVQTGEPYSIKDIPFNDKDLEHLLNLARPLKHEPIYEYPVNLLTDESTSFPTVWFVGTSFYWYMTRRVNFDLLFRFRDLLFYDAVFYTHSEQIQYPADNFDYLHELLLHDYVVFFRDGPQYYTNWIFPGKSLISLCISDERMKEKTEAIADSLAVAWNEKHPENNRDSYLYLAEILLYKNPELFEEFRGDGLPSYRNPRIAQVLVERNIRADHNWSFLLEAKAKNDSLDARALFMTESSNVLNHQPLLRDNVYFTTYDYFDFLVNEAIIDLQRHCPGSLTDAEAFDKVKDEIETQIHQHAFDDDTLMKAACAMDAIVKELSKEDILSEIRRKADERHISFDKAFRDDVGWCFRNGKDNDRYLNEETLLSAFEAYQIERDLWEYKDAVANIMQKHNELDLPLRVVINRDIKWIQKNREKQ